MMGDSSVSVIVPTFHEAPNIVPLVERIERIRDDHGLDLEVLFMDDDSRDGIVDIVSSLNRDWVRVHVRTKNRGLSAAVLDGFTLAQKEALLVMDADLSHPPEIIPAMLDALNGGADFVVGSRYVEGGATEESWGVLRWLNSKAATLLARPFTRIKDPMSGLFCFHRAQLDTAAPLNPVGYKIGLEILVKCDCRHVIEIPIFFRQRHEGESKLSLREQLLYLEHLRRLAEFKFGDWARVLLFAAVGVSGVVVNLLALTALVLSGIPVRVAVAVAIFLAMLSNFALNRQFTFAYARQGRWLRQLCGFVAASSVGAALNYGVTLSILHYFPMTENFPQLAACCGIVAGMTLNYLASRYLVFPISR